MKPGARYLVRIEVPEKYTIGWQARPPGRPTRFFSDRKHGGTEAARRAAFRYIESPYQIQLRSYLNAMVDEYSSTGAVDVEYFAGKIEDLYGPRRVRRRSVREE
jgi:hypothetical protein